MTLLSKHVWLAHKTKQANLAENFNRCWHLLLTDAFIFLLLVGCLQCIRYTSKVTGHHRGPKQKILAGYRALSLQRTGWLLSAVSKSHIMSQAPSLQYMPYVAMCFHHWVRYRVHSLALCTMRVFEAWASSSSPRLPLCQI